MTERPASQPASAARGLRILGACDNYTPASSGGAEKAGHELYERFGSAGAKVRVLGVPHGTPYVDIGVETVSARGVDLSRLLGGYLCVSPATFRMALSEASDFQPDVLHANTLHYNSCVALAHIARSRDIPFVVTAQLGPATEMPMLTRAASALYDRVVGRYIVKRADRILAVSQTVKQHVIQLGANPARVRVVENGVDHARFECEPLTARTRPTVMAIGRLVHNKGPQLLVDAALELLADGLEFDVRFLGDGPLRAELQERVDRAGRGDNVSFLGQVGDVERWVAEADIVVRPSFTEGLPLAVLEAMAAGRCNIVSDIPPNLELIADGQTGLTFRVGSTADLVRQLRRAIVDVDLRRCLGRAGYEASLPRSWDRMASETARVLAHEVRSAAGA